MSEHSYDIDTDIRFGPLELVDIKSLADACDVPWFNRTVAKVNDCVIRLGVVQGEFHWHHHDDEDEFFYVVSGQLLVDLEDKTLTLDPGQGVMVPRGVKHRTRAPTRTVMLMTEGAGVVPTGD